MRSKNILKFNDFKINEMTEFNLQRFNSDSVQASVHVDNPQLSTNAFDKHQDGIRQAMSRVSDIMFNLTNTTAFRNLRSKMGLDEQNIQSMKILKIVKSNNINYDVYISIFIDNFEYWGVVTNILTPNPEFKSELFKDFDLYQTKEWIIKIKGLVIKAIKNWLKVETGWYRLLNDEVICYSTETGKMLRMDKGIEIELIRSYENRILIKHETDTYNLIGDNFIYFNWWFEKI
jgi:hypothetical protein